MVYLLTLNSTLHASSKIHYLVQVLHAAVAVTHHRSRLRLGLLATILTSHVANRATGSLHLQLHLSGFA